MGREVMGSSQACWQVKDGFAVAQEMLVVHVHHAQLAQGLHQLLHLVVDAEGELECLLLLGTAQYHGATCGWREHEDRKSTRLNSSHLVISYAVFCLKKKTICRYAILSQATKFLQQIIRHLLA